LASLMRVVLIFVCWFLAALLDVCAFCVVYAHFSPAPPLWAYSGTPPLFSLKGSNGTGFFVSRDGDIITNRHVAKDCSLMTISGYQIRAERVKLLRFPQDEGIDLALLKADIIAPAFLSFSNDTWPYHYDGKPSRVKLLDDEWANLYLKVRLSPEQTGAGTLIGYPGSEVLTAPVSNPVQFTRWISSNDYTHWYPKIRGLTVSGESGSPILYPSGKVAGVLFVGQFEVNSRSALDKAIAKWKAQQAAGVAIKNDEGGIIPGPVAASFARSAGVALSGEVAGDPAKAVVRIYCFYGGWP